MQQHFTPTPSHTSVQSRSLAPRCSWSTLTGACRLALHCRRHLRRNVCVPHCHRQRQCAMLCIQVDIVRCKGPGGLPVRRQEHHALTLRPTLLLLPLLC